MAALLPFGIAGEAAFLTTRLKTKLWMISKVAPANYEL